LFIVEDASQWIREWEPLPRDVQYDKPGEFTAAEADAREHRRGLWADPSPVPPWEWRRATRQAPKSH
jgi:micrococcal nuclease